MRLLIALVLIAGAASLVATKPRRHRVVRRRTFATPEGAMFARLMSE